MYAVILCAGEGTRIREFSGLNLPKPLIKIEKTSILEKLVQNLYHIGIEKIGLVKGHLGHRIDDFARKFIKKNKIRSENLIIIDSETDYKLGPLHSLLSIRNDNLFFTKKINYLIIPGDVIFELELLQNIIDKINQRTDDSPIVFYKETNCYDLDKNIVPIVNSRMEESKVILEKIEQVVRFDGELIINLIVPFFFSTYNYIESISQFEYIKSIETLREAINLSIKKGFIINVINLQSEKAFYDIDSESDIKEYLKKK